MRLNIVTQNIRYTGYAGIAFQNTMNGELYTCKKAEKATLSQPKVKYETIF